MRHFTGYGAYQLFLALRTHFTSNKYDFFQMHGKLRATKESYTKRNDRMFFEKLAKTYDPETLRDFYVANFLEDKHYITELLDDTATTNLVKYQGRRQALSYNVSNDVDMVLRNGSCDAFKTHSDQYPGVLVLYLQRRICMESLVVMNDFILFREKFDKYYDDDVIWPKVSLKMQKYRPFIKYDKERMKLILKERIDENSRGQCV
jgi:hypothetical protein